MSAVCRCVECGSDFAIGDDERRFLAKVSPRLSSGVRLDIPLPTRCPPCRLRRRFAHRNQIYVTRRPLASGQEAFAMFLGDVRFPLIKAGDWWDENGWRAEDYGRPFDFTRPFFEQWRELRDAVPHPALNVNEAEMDNSSYCNNVNELKNCYLCFDANTLEDCSYLETAVSCRDCLDCSIVFNCELCTDCAACTRCYELQSSTHCTDCTRSAFLFNCRSCNQCFGCVNLRRRKYCIYNEQVSEGRYEAFMKSIDFSAWQAREEFAGRLEQLLAQHPQPHLYGSQLEDCTGNIIHNARQVYDSCLVHGGERLRYCFAVGQNLNDCQDYTIWGRNAELIYEAVVCGGGVFRLLFCLNCWNNAADLLYCDSCHGSQQCFGCVSMLKRRFCILNRRYPEAEYEKLLPRIVDHLRQTGEWGEFFPVETSACPYNCSLAQRYFPLSKADCLARGCAWHDLTGPGGVKGADAAELPDTLPANDSPWIIHSAASGRAFSVSVQELKQLRRHRAPLPRCTYDERMDARMRRVGGIILRERRCARSGELLKTVHLPDSRFAVWERELLERELQQ